MWCSWWTLWTVFHWILKTRTTKSGFQCEMFVFSCFQLENSSILLYILIWSVMWPSGLAVNVNMGRCLCTLSYLLLPLLFFITPLLYHKVSFWPALALLRPPTLVNNLFCLSVILDLPLTLYVCVCERDISCSQFREHYMNHWAVWCLLTWLVCLPSFCVCCLARFAGHDAWLSWWKCILAKRMDKGRAAEGTRVRVGGFGWRLQRC